MQEEKANRTRKERADKLLFNRGLAESRQKAQALILAGNVFFRDKRIEKAGQMIDVDQEIFLKSNLLYVSRGGLKLEEALKVFQVSVKDKTAADLGASTGGFTDCLLKNGAKKVYAVDVNTRQLDWNLRKDPRVFLIERNARYLNRYDFPETLDIVTSDLSFISVIKVLPAVKGILGEGKLISLIKPQFEVRKNQVGKRGIVRNPSLHEEVLMRIIEEAEKMGFYFEKVFKCSVRGQKGNQEFFIIFSLNGQTLPHAERQRLIKEAVWNEKD